MLSLFNEGGPLFMGILTLLMLLMLIQAVRTWIKMKDPTLNLETARLHLGYVRSLGLLALVTGIFGQLIGLYQAFDAIQQMKTVSPAILAGGLKVSMITTLYGTFIFIVGIILWMLLNARVNTDGGQSAAAV